MIKAVILAQGIEPSPVIGPEEAPMGAYFRDGFWLLNRVRTHQHMISWVIIMNDESLPLMYVESTINSRPIYE